jgi:prephenate dehydrogenase
VIAFSVMNAILDAQISGVDCLTYAGSAFNGLTRVAASPVEMWRDICISNRDALLVAIDEFEKALAHLKACVAQGDSAGLAAAINRARVERQRLTKMREPS